MKIVSQFGAAAAALIAVAGAAQAQSFTEHFDDTTLLPGLGWFEQNNSNPPGVIGYFQGNLDVFAPQSTDGYLGVNYNSTSAVGTISNWMVMPTSNLQNGDTLTFWTRTVDNRTYPDRLQVRMSTSGASTNVGTGEEDVGDFTTVLLDINPTLVATGFPNVWTQYTVTLSGLPAGGASGRLAFRYYVTNAGPSGANSDYIGIDEVVYTAGGAPPPACYANCDNSTNPPVLNVNDFICFQASFAAGGSYANCDTSTTPPVLNVNDFICFQQAFAAGCTAP